MAVRLTRLSPPNSTPHVHDFIVTQPHDRLQYGVPDSFDGLVPQSLDADFVARAETAMPGLTEEQPFRADRGNRGQNSALVAARYAER